MSPEFEIECKPDQYLEVTPGYGTRMFRLETWWATVGEETTYKWDFEVLNSASSFLYYFDYGEYGSYGTTLQGGAGAAVIATITAGDAEGNTDSCSFLMMLWPRGSELKAAIEKSIVRAKYAHTAPFCQTLREWEGKISRLRTTFSCGAADSANQPWFRGKDPTLKSSATPTQIQGLFEATG